MGLIAIYFYVLVPNGIYLFNNVYPLSNAFVVYLMTVSYNLLCEEYSPFFYEKLLSMSNKNVITY